MRIPNLLFIVFILLVVVANLIIYNVFIYEFRGDKIYQAQIEQKNDKIAQSEKEKLLLNFQIKDFEQSVALALPEKKKQNQFQNKFSQALRIPASIPKLDLSKAQFENGKIEFKNKKYALAIKEFQNLLDKYPISEHTVEAYFMISESQFLSKNYTECLNTINILLELYPTHDLTGFSLLRLAAMNEMNGRYDVALEVYKTIRTNFSHSYLLSEVTKKEKLIETKGL